MTAPPPAPKTVSRTADEIYTDIRAAMTTTTEDALELPTDVLVAHQASRTARLHALWSELTDAVLGDAGVPMWAAVAAGLVRNRYENDLNRTVST